MTKRPRIKSIAHFGMHPTDDAKVLATLMEKHFDIVCVTEPVDEGRYSMVHSKNEIYMGLEKIIKTQAYVAGFRAYRQHCLC